MDRADAPPAPQFHTTTHFASIAAAQLMTAGANVPSTPNALKNVERLRVRRKGTDLLGRGGRGEIYRSVWGDLCSSRATDLTSPPTHSTLSSMMRSLYSSSRSVWNTRPESLAYNT